MDALDETSSPSLKSGGCRSSGPGRIRSKRGRGIEDDPERKGKRDLKVRDKGEGISGEPRHLQKTLKHSKYSRRFNRGP